MDEKKLKCVVKRSNWNEAAANLLVPLCESDPFVSIEGWEEEVLAKIMALFEVYDNEGLLSGVFLVRIDESSECNELVVVGAAGKTPNYEPGESIYDLITPYVIKLAQSADCSHVRAHTERKGVVKLLEKAGYKLGEYVCRIEVNNVQ